MLPGYDGHLVSEYCLEQTIAADALDPALLAALRRRLMAWRTAQAALGPASSLRSMFDASAPGQAVSMPAVGMRAPPSG